MSLANVEQTSELVQAQAHVWNHIFKFVDSMSLKCSIQFGIFDVIHNHGQPMSLSQLVAALPVADSTKTRSISRMMRILIHSGFVSLKKLDDTNDEDEVYVLTPASKLLLKDGPFRISPLLMANLDPVLTTSWHSLSDWLFQNDKGIATSFETAHGTTFYDNLANDSRLKGVFYETMSNDSKLVTTLMLRECKGVFEGLESLVDDGGGTGAVAKGISSAFPNLECTVFDLPHVVDDLKKGNTKHLQFVGGDMFEAIPPANAILLKWILHNWNDEESIKILKRCKEAIPNKEKGGKVIIIDMTINKNQKDNDEQSVYETQIFFDMVMMVLYNGMERTENEWKKLFLDAGFSHYKIVTPRLSAEHYIELNTYGAEFRI